MPLTGPRAPRVYPSRRSLREAQQRTEAPPTPQEHELASEQATEATPLSRRELRARSRAEQPPSVDPLSLPQLPVQPFLSGADDPTDRDATPSAAAAKQPAPLRSRAYRWLLRGTGYASAAALAGAFALPTLQLFAPATDGLGGVYSEHASVSTARFDSGELDALAGVMVEDAGPAGSFVNHSDAEVQFPFPNSVRLTDGFGYRTAPVAQFHDAQDFAAPAGALIQAIADGTVTEAGFASDGCGFALTLEHEIDGHEVTSRYCHMVPGSHSYEIGDQLSVTDPVGRVGATGLAFGAHLHLAIRVDDEPVDPMIFLTTYNEQTRPGV